ncbi:unnamed protein product (macronuclear) [Paramecium tetraurelia]|uniref:Transmembrane protein n=1 Tax=Paramecium tetraurelia TaxID=5888 RepID=A0C462_PARTE|nr:uncharacterized protein GSPATT00035059001 [Paramecium tetraurelia]CAK65579.1 unnamed protein product [Paramecium tetraurelia]|eukprot:XP_001432976.1 hypothetical protein (macronuclear) [Paramecium tetraurelia strain d4-2]
MDQNNVDTKNTFYKSIYICVGTNLFELQKYFLFGTSEYKGYIVDAQIQTQTNSFEYCQKAYQNDVIGAVYLGMRGTQEKTILEYPRLGDLLANIGSIVSILFMFKYMIMYLNEFYLNQKVLEELISFYYPEFKKIEIKKNWFGKIVQVRFNQMKFFDKASKQMQQKLSYLNLLYEISRLYFVIRSSKFRNEFYKSHQIGIKDQFSLVQRYRDACQLKVRKTF